MDDGAVERAADSLKYFDAKPEKYWKTEDSNFNAQTMMNKGEQYKMFHYPDNAYNQKKYLSDKFRITTSNQVCSEGQFSNISRIMFYYKNLSYEIWIEKSETSCLSFHTTIFMKMDY